MSKKFELFSAYKPEGDQPTAIDTLNKSIEEGNRYQTLLGATGTGKTFTMANVIAKQNRPTLIIAQNKTLVAQLYSEFKEFFPNNAVEYFVSYYNHFQPEVYMPASDTFIEKDASINDEIDQMRHSATSSLLERRDVIVVASVSAIYGLGDPKEYKDMNLFLRIGEEMPRNEILKRLVNIRYERNDVSFTRGKFRVRGDVIEVYPASHNDKAIRIELFGDEVERICEINPLTGAVTEDKQYIVIFPSAHFVTRPEKMKSSCRNIELELEQRIAQFRTNKKFLEAERIEQRTRNDIESLLEWGYCPGVENYSAPLSFREPGSTPSTLLDYFPDDFITIIDESHVTLPQIRGMYNGDRARKETLVEHGFRLPSALDNRPLKYSEFEEKTKQMIYVSATPAPAELGTSQVVAEQVIRPTGLLDPVVEVRPSTDQIDDLIESIRERVSNKEKVLVTTLTKKMSEDLTEYLKDVGLRVKYMHSEIKTIERLEIIQGLRLNKFDVLIGINLLREGLDIPEVSLVAILDADKEGFLRSETSLIQTIGRAARNSNGKVIMYANKITESMRKAIEETERRRTKQEKFNKKNNVTPTTIIKKIHDIIETTRPDSEVKKKAPVETDITKMSPEERKKYIAKLEKEMKVASKNLLFEKALELRDLMEEIKKI